MQPNSQRSVLKLIKLSTGAGKTTLLNTLNGRLPYNGEILAGNTPLNKSLQRKMCYVLQQEFFFANLSLKETLEVSKGAASWNFCSQCGAN